MSPPPHPSFLILPQAYMSDNNKRTRELILLKICFWTLSRISLQSSLLSNCISLHNILMKKMRSNKRNCMKYIKYKNCEHAECVNLLFCSIPDPHQHHFSLQFIFIFTPQFLITNIYQNKEAPLYITYPPLHRYGTVLWILIKFILNVLIYSVVVSNCFI